MDARGRALLAIVMAQAPAIQHSNTARLGVSAPGVFAPRTRIAIMGNGIVVGSAASSAMWVGATVRVLVAGYRGTRQPKLQTAVLERHVVMGLVRERQRVREE